MPSVHFSAEQVNNLTGSEWHKSCERCHSPGFPWDYRVNVVQVMSEVGWISLASGCSWHHGIDEMSLETPLKAVQYALVWTEFILIGCVSNLMIQVYVVNGQRLCHVY